MSADIFGCQKWAKRNTAASLARKSWDVVNIPPNAEDNPILAQNVSGAQAWYAYSMYLGSLRLHSITFKSVLIPANNSVPQLQAFNTPPLCEYQDQTHFLPTQFLLLSWKEMSLFLTSSLSASLWVQLIPVSNSSEMPSLSGLFSPFSSSPKRGPL